MLERAAGTLLHPTSLPGRFGIGDTGREAYAFLDWLEGTGQTVWQVLPLGPASRGNSPYGAASAFGGNPMLVAPGRLRDEGLLPPGILDDAPLFPDEEVDYRRVVPWKLGILRASWEHVQKDGRPDVIEAFEAFLEAPEQQDWLSDWSLYAALKKESGGKPWTAWDGPIRRREPAALNAARKALAADLRFHAWQQFLFFWQWEALKAEANRRGLRIMGDLPIYVSPDSADVWANSHLFHLDRSGRPTAVAGVPPDYFSSTGQLWGNPLYRWDAMEEEGYAWWVARIRANLRVADLVRIDHFRAFAAYWEVPAGATDATGGRWAPGPGRKVFDAIRNALGDLPLVAEDLGHITDDVHELRRSLELPGMRVLQFAFTDPWSNHRPDRFEPNTVAYTGTHDNDTTVGWWASIGDEERGRAREFLGDVEAEGIHWAMIRAAFESRAELVLVPLQDVLGLGSDARMNTPGIADGNWRWRARRDAEDEAAARRLRELVERTGRLR
jgi:4-alpha-glucanotransferase